MADPTSDPATPDPTDEEVWERVKASMPLHGCGERMQPGGDPTIGHVLVCLNCSYFEGVDPEWVGQVVDAARRELSRG